MRNVLVLQHAYCETLGTILNILKSNKVSVNIVRTFNGEPIPEKINNHHALIILGGPMGVYDYSYYPFLLKEILLIKQALQKEKPILGICLGSQLLAKALGAEVLKGKKKEIGWHFVKLTKFAMKDKLLSGIKPYFMAFHWHGDFFKLPKDAIPLASSKITKYQAFRYGSNAYGFLFHMEVTEKIIECMINTFKTELQEASISDFEIITKTKKYLPYLQEIGKLVFQRWISLIKKEL